VPLPDLAGINTGVDGYLAEREGVNKKFSGGRPAGGRWDYSPDLSFSINREISLVFVPGIDLSFRIIERRPELT
jgi:hypothetical protein